MHLSSRLFFGISAVAIGCGTSAPMGTEPLAPDGGADVASETSACPSGGDASIEVVVSGLPSGATPKVTVTTAAGAREATPGANSLPAGAASVTAADVIVGDPLVRTVYRATATPSDLCIAAGATVTIAYAPVPTSNALWITSGNSPRELHGFASASLAASGAPSPKTEAKVEIPAGTAFDRRGGLWVAIGSAGGKVLAHYPPEALAATGTPTPDVKIEGAILNEGIPGASGLALDRDGNLWVAVTTSGKILRYDAAAITASGSPAPSVILSGAQGPSALAFDAAGNLWVGELKANRVSKWASARLSASSSDPPDVSLKAQTPPPVTTNLQRPAGLAFDATDGLWVNWNGLVLRFTPEDRAGTGEKVLVPAVQVTLAVTALPEGIAFDEGGGLWLAYSAGKVARLSPTQLATSGRVTPETVLESGAIGAGKELAFYPAPAKLPIHAALP
jgi:sugar lactone lactonase YvrE